MFDRKKWVKNGQILNASYENEIHRVDSSLNENSKNITFLAREALILGEGWPENLGKMAETRETYCYVN